ncbi:MAG: hypothetical protein J0M09_10925 [Xanthomonadales bacterium]|nr:hypothetical protein [Xanthomonadales bacterium]
MKTMLKTGLLVAAVALTFSMPSGTANAGAGVCFRAYQACIAAGNDIAVCEAEYWDCRGMSPPVRIVGNVNRGN